MLPNRVAGTGRCVRSHNCVISQSLGTAAGGDGAGYRQQVLPVTGHMGHLVTDSVNSVTTGNDVITSWL